MTRIEEIRARLEAATPGPWEFSNSSDVRESKGEFRAPNPHNGFMLVGPWTNDADAAFIAHSREDVPFLLAEVTKLRAIIEEAKTLRTDLASLSAVAVVAGLMNEHYAHNVAINRLDAILAKATPEGGTK